MAGRDRRINEPANPRMTGKPPATRIVNTYICA
jgi:hypothetical protein